ncbi:MAG: GWxTD domain-containing protein [Candidatus Aminicenantes bacterium]|nr:GWxTD domain-containing protein [Candidatus Aminicenantes bacterium]
MSIHRFIRLFLVLVLLGSAAGCALYRLEKDLPASYAAFLSEVRYLITSAERKAFLSTPDSGKDKFIQEFWTRRDPDAFTPENELRTEYYARISQADQLFKTDIPEGWLSERGRIYILYGQPTERRQITGRLTQESVTAGQVEIWSYGGFELTFRDAKGTGSYRLETLDLGPIEDLNLARYGVSPQRGNSRSPVFAGRQVSKARPSLDFTLELQDAGRTDERRSALVRLEIPLPLIWFRSENGRFLTTFDVAVRVRDSQKGVVWEKDIGVDADYDMRDFSARSRERHVIEIPILIEGAEILARLAEAPGTLAVRLTNRTGSESVEKTIELK